MNNEEKKLLEYLHEQKLELKQSEKELKEFVIPTPEKSEYKENKVIDKKKIRAFHLTKKENIYGENGICSKGLIPTCGERSRSIGDKRSVVSFSSNYYTSPVWMIYLYPGVDPSDLCVLSFEIDKKDCINHINDTEFFTYNTIPPEKINIVSFYDKKTLEEIPFYHLQENAMRRYGQDILLSKQEIVLRETPITELIKNKHM